MSSPVKSYYLDLVRTEYFSFCPHNTYTKRAGWKSGADSIISDSELFWLAFCEARIEKQKNSRLFHVIRSGDSISVDGHSTLINDIKEIIEKIREKLVSKGSVDIYENVKAETCRFDLDISLSANGFSSTVYFDFVQPILPQLAQQLSLSYVSASISDGSVKVTLTLPNFSA